VFDDHDRCYRIVQGRDPRFDGCFVTAVRTTGIYCRPSCPARTPKPANVEFFPTAAAAQLAGYRACKRCRPDASPGSPEWNGRSDVVARAMRLIADGVVDREGVPALARRLGYSDRHLNRLLLAELGAGPLALARSQRAQNARVLIETTSIPMVDVAFAAGFASLRQFNDTVRQVFAASPTELRVAAARRRPAERCAATGAANTLSLRLAHRRPLAAPALWEFLRARCIAGTESFDLSGSVEVYRRTLDLPLGHGVVALAPGDGHVDAVLRLADVRDLTAAVARCRRLLDLDADPEAIDARLSLDSALAPLVAARPGLRSPGAVDGFEMAVRAVLGQQVSVAASIRSAGRFVAELGEELSFEDAGLDRLFPTPDALAALDPESLPMPRQRAAALVQLGDAVASGRLRLDPGADRSEARQVLLGIPGIGPWTADYVAMRALGDPDVMAGGDLVVRQRAARLGIGPSELAARSLEWAPWRTTVVHHLWAADDSTTTEKEAA
jgi:AraC family transcriptional regulator of adaptative response / DNA-3-methyladenine glycosylase II